MSLPLSRRRFSRAASLLVPLCLALGCNGPLSDESPAPPTAPTFSPPASTPTDPEGLGSAAWDPERAEEVLDATWYGDVLVSNDAFVLEQAPDFVTWSATASSVTIDFTSPAAASGLREGSVLVSGFDGGLLRRVESVSFEDTRAFAVTTEARLTEVVYYAQHFERIPLELEPGDLPESGSRDPWTYDFSGRPLFAVGSGANQASADIQSGSVTLEPGFDWGLDVDWFDWNRPWPKLNKADLGVTLDAQLEVVVHAEAQGAFDKEGELDLFAFDKDVNFQVGPVPVAGDLHFDVDLVWEVDGTGAADGSIGTRVDTSMGLGGRYMDGDWENTSGFEWTATRIGPTIELDAGLHVHAAIRIRATASLYNSVSADLSAKPWADATAELDCGAVDWALDVGVELDSKVGYDILSFTGDHTFPTFTWSQEPLASGQLALFDAAALGDSCGPGETPPTEDSVVEGPGDAVGGSDVWSETEDERLEELSHEDCIDGIDNDGDASVDCDDDECANRMVCGSECAVWDNLVCGQTISADTAGIVDARPSRINGYPINTGLYDGPEIGFAFRSPITAEIAFELVDPDPTEVNHDIMVLHTPTGTCDSSDAVAWGFNDALVEVTRGEQYIVVIDGFDGDSGGFTLKVNCAP
jgi:hypothetical protein